MSDKIKVHFLGTSSSTPTVERSLTSMLINYKGVNYLFDAPENTQQQIMKANASIMKIDNIFITHFHGDHFFGLPGLLATMELSNRTNEINIFVPVGFKKRLDDFIKSTRMKISYRVNLIEAKVGEIFNNRFVSVSSLKLNHSIETNGYVFKVIDRIGKFNRQKAIKLKIPEGPLYRELQEGKSIKVDGKKIEAKQVMDYKFKKIGKSIGYLTDTSVIKTFPKFLKDVDVLVHESTYLFEARDMAKARKHSTAEEVALFAKKINAKQLYLVHISTRYKDEKLIEDEAKKKFKKSSCPKELDVVELDDFN
jgi:ribonuclease Z